MLSIQNSATQSMQTACVVIPCHKLPLSVDEQLSWKSLQTKLPHVQKFVVAPKRLLHIAEYFPEATGVIHFPNHFFTYPHGYNSLLLSSAFYKKFKPFQFLLLYQLDCLICGDNLKDWCSKGWDYIGAPWSNDFDSSQSTEFTAVGNGGFSLRSIQSALNVLHMRVNYPLQVANKNDIKWLKCRNNSKFICSLSRFEGIFGVLTVERFLRRFYVGNEDIFWGLYSQLFDPTFRVPAPKEALSFAFEINPSASYEKNGRTLPFGCHAWPRYDRGFWEKMGMAPFASPAGDATA